MRTAFEAWVKPLDEIPIGYQDVCCHLILGVKMGENFCRKARFVASGGHTTDVPSTLTYASVVSRDSVGIALTNAALNGLKVMACDIQNAYLNADCREKILTRAGPEFGSEAGTVFILRKALYGLKSAGAAFRALLAETLYDIGYVPSRADPDVWLRPAVTPDDDPELSLQELQSAFKLKDKKVEEPEMYLRAQLGKMQIDGENVGRCRLSRMLKRH
jgi:hypothetical protein